jgi:hypothetical protein
MGGFADRNDEETAVRVQVVKVFANSQHPAIALNVTGEGAID